MKRGKFITLEGGEGAGKTANLAFVRDRLEQYLGHAPLATREPGGTPVGEEIRRIFLLGESLAPEAELLLVFAARIQHLRDVVEPALARGQWVLCDRFTDASYAYQGGGRGVDEAHITYLENWLQARPDSCKPLRPDWTVLLDVSPAIGRARARGRGELDRFDAETDGFYGRVRAAYLERARCEPGRIAVIDASQALEGVQQDIGLALQLWLDTV